MAQNRGRGPWLTLAIVLVTLGLISCDGGAAPSEVQPSVAPTTASTFVVRYLGRPAQGPINFAVCSRNDTWQRPSLEAQMDYMGTDYRVARYGSGFGGLPPRLLESFEASFWCDVFSASGLFSMADLSGLWTAREAGVDLRKALSGGVCSPHVNQSRDLLNLWLLGYEAVEAGSDGSDRVFVRVQPVDAGFEVIQLKVPGGTSCCPGLAVDFIDASGTVLESIGQQSM